MKTFTLINLLTRKMVTLEANSRLHARRMALDIANSTTGQYTDLCYWIEKQAYHDTTGYEVLA